jgi:hypothetical protein
MMPNSAEPKSFRPRLKVARPLLLIIHSRLGKPHFALIEEALPFGNVEPNIHDEPSP